MLLTHHHSSSWAEPFFSLMGEKLRHIRFNHTLSMRALYVLFSFESIGCDMFPAMLSTLDNYALDGWLNGWMKALVVKKHPCYKQLKSKYQKTPSQQTSKIKLLAYLIMTPKKRSLAHRWVSYLVCFQEPMIFCPQLSL